MINYLVGDKIRLVRFSDRYITPQYHSWLNDQEVNKYLYVGRIPILYNELSVPPSSDTSTIKFAIVSNVGVDSNNQLWQDDDYRHYIGTATIHGIDWICRRAEIGYMVGNKNYWGAGITTELVRLLTEYCFGKLNLNKIVANVVDGNIGSVKVLEKNGFKQYATEIKEFYSDGKYLDAYRFHNFQDWYHQQDVSD